MKTVGRLEVEERVFGLDKLSLQRSGFGELIVVCGMD